MSLQDLLAVPETDPSILYRYRDGMSAVDVVAAAAVHLDLFTGIAAEGGRVSLGRICERFSLHPRAADVAMTLFVAMGLANRVGREEFELTKLAREHLVKGSRWDVTPYYGAMRNRPQTLDMVKVLRTGRPANWGSYDHQEWIKAMERPEFAASFTAAMDCRGVLLASGMARGVDLKGRRAVLDVAGGSGIYACALVAANDGLKGAVMERSPVDRIAREAIEKRGAAGRVEVITADMFAGKWPGGFDVHVLSNVLHDWEEPIVKDLIARSAGAIDRGGLLIVHDAFLNDDKTGPLPVAEYSALLMTICEGRCYSVGEMRGHLQEAGFEWVDHVPTGIGRSAIVARRG